MRTTDADTDARSRPGQNLTRHTTAAGGRATAYRGQQDTRAMLPKASHSGSHTVRQRMGRRAAIRHSGTQPRMAAIPHGLARRIGGPAAMKIKIK